MATLLVVDRDPASLKNHDLNVRIYGDQVDQEFLDSTEGGIENPITICQSTDPVLNDVIVKGRRRRFAAVSHGFKTVPCIVWACDDPLEVERQLILDNVRNETTTEQRARMFEELLRINAARASLRMMAGVKDQKEAGIVITKAQKRSKRSDEVSARSCGMSASTAQKAVVVVRAVDSLAAEGRTEDANAVRSALNNKSVASAARTLADITQGVKVDKKSPESIEIDRHLAKLIAAVKLSITSAECIINSIDRKCEATPSFKSYKKKFETLLRHMSDLLDPCIYHAEVIRTAWVSLQKVVDS